jgi:hypothetical protein
MLVKSLGTLESSHRLVLRARWRSWLDAVYGTTQCGLPPSGGEHEKECQFFFFRVPRGGRKVRYADTIFTLLRHCAIEFITRIHRVLEDACLKLDAVASDIHGASGRAGVSYRRSFSA